MQQASLLVKKAEFIQTGVCQKCNWPNIIKVANWLEVDRFVNAHCSDCNCYTEHLIKGDSPHQRLTFNKSQHIFSSSSYTKSKGEFY